MKDEGAEESRETFEDELKSGHRMPGGLRVEGPQDISHSDSLLRTGATGAGCSRPCLSRL